MPPAPQPRRALVVSAFACVYIVWGSTYLAIRVGIESFPPLLLAGLRFTIAGAGMLAALAVAGKRVRLPSGQLRVLAVIGAFLLLGGNGGVVWAEQIVPSGLAALIIATVPLWMAGLATLPPWRERLDGSAVLGLALGFAGVAVLMSPAFAETHGDPRGVLAVALAALSWSCGSLYARRAALRINPLIATAWEMLLGGSMFLVIALVTGTRMPSHPRPEAVVALLYLISFGSWVAFTAYVWLLATVPAAKVATYAYVNPVIAVILGWWLLSEPITATVVAGSALIVIAVVLVTWPRAPHAEAIAELAPAAAVEGESA